MNMGLFGVCGTSIIAISIGGTSTIIVNSIFGITTGSISDVLILFWGAVSVFEILIAFTQYILVFFWSMLNQHHCQYHLRNQKNHCHQHQVYQCQGHQSILSLFFLVSGTILKY